jgi:hypothetical protein
MGFGSGGVGLTWSSSVELTWVAEPHCIVPSESSAAQAKTTGPLGFIGASSGARISADALSPVRHSERGPPLDDSASVMPDMAHPFRWRLRDSQCR